MAGGAIFVDAIVYAVADDCCHRTQVRQARPEAIEQLHVRVVQLFRPGSPEALAWIVEVPRIEIDHLWPFNGNDAADLTGFYRPRLSGPCGNNKLLENRPFFRSGCEPAVENSINCQWRAARGFVKWIWQIGRAH